MTESQETPDHETDAATPGPTPSNLTDFETLMLSLDADPWLNPSGGLLTVLDRPVNQKHFRRSLQKAVANVPALRKRVSPATTRLTTPRWETDPEFDFDYHVRTMALPASACDFEDLLELASWLYQQPFDRTRPLWQMVAVEGLSDGRAALISNTHHIIGDASTMMAMAEHYLQLSRTDTMPSQVDLAAIFDAETKGRQIPSANPVDALAAAATETITSVAKRQGDALRKAIGEVITWGADPARAKDFGSETVAKATSALEQLSPSAQGGGSDLWSERSRHRNLQALQIPLDEAKAAAKSLGGSINDFFVTGAVMASLAYHDKHDATLKSINLSLVVSTRDGNEEAANAFAPMSLQAPAAAQTPAERFTSLQGLMADQIRAAKSGGSLTGLAGGLNLLPLSLVTSTARSQASNLDFATSNFRGAPIEVYISGAKVLQHVPFGPLAGTAFNLTVMSYDNSLDFGVFIDPTAVAEPTALRDCLQHAYTELLGAG